MADANYKRSLQGHDYNLITALRRNPTTINACVDICKEAADLILSLQDELTDKEEWINKTIKQLAINDKQIKETQMQSISDLGQAHEAYEKCCLLEAQIKISSIYTRIKTLDEVEQWFVDYNNVTALALYKVMRKQSSNKKVVKK